MLVLSTGQPRKSCQTSVTSFQPMSMAWVWYSTRWLVGMSLFRIWSHWLWWWPLLYSVSNQKCRHQQIQKSYKLSKGMHNVFVLFPRCICTSELLIARILFSSLPPSCIEWDPLSRSSLSSVISRLMDLLPQPKVADETAKPPLQHQDRCVCVSVSVLWMWDGIYLTLPKKVLYKIILLTSFLYLLST